MLMVAIGGWWYVHKWAAFGSPLAYPYTRPLGSLPADQRLVMLSVVPGSILLYAFAPADVLSAKVDSVLLLRFFGLLSIVVLLGLGAFYRRPRPQVPRVGDALAVDLPPGAARDFGRYRPRGNDD